MKEQTIEIARENETVWDRHWAGQKEMPLWDYGSYMIWKVLKRELGNVEGKRIAECGSGTGRISMRLIQEGARGILLDKSPAALSLGKWIFVQENVKGMFIQGTLLSLPFKDESCDIVWNSGVLEHFQEEEQIQCLREMSRVCKKDGSIIVFCPYRSIFHRIGKAILEKLNRWPYGYEEPVVSLADRGKRVNLYLFKKEYTFGILVYLVEAVRFIIPGGIGLKVTQLLRNVAIASHEGPARPIIEFLDTLASRVFGGYILVSVFRRF